MITVLNRLWLLTMLFVACLATVKAQTITLSNGDPTGNPTDAFDGNVFQAGTQIGDASIYAVLGGGTKSFQIVSPGESLTKTVSSTGYFTIRPTSNIVVDQSKIFSFSGTVTGSVAITVRPLSITTISANVATEVFPGSELTVSYRTGAGTFPIELALGKFKVQLLDANGGLFRDLLNSTDQYTNSEKFGSSRGGTRSIRATIPAAILSGTYRVRVVTLGLNTPVIGSSSGLFTIKDNTPFINTGSIGTGILCAGASVSFPYSTTGAFPSGNQFKVQLANADGTTFQDLSGTSLTSPIQATLPATLSAGAYRFRIAATATNVTSVTNAISVSTLPTMTISGSSTITTGTTAPVQLTFTGTPPWSFTYTDNNVTRAASSSGSFVTVSPTFQSTTTYDKSFITGFRDNGCGSSGLISGSAQITVRQVTITTGSLSGSYCPGSAVSVPFTVSSPLPANVVYQVQISDNNGSFVNGPVIGSGAGPSSVTATIPQTLTPGTGYRLRVVPSNFGTVEYVVSSLTISQPDAPKVANLSICSGTTTAPLSATGTNLKWYTSSTNAQPLTSAPTPPNGQSSVYYVSQTIDNCESTRQPISVSVVASPIAPTVSNITLCQGAQGQFPTTISGALWYTSPTSGTASAQPPTLNNQTAGEQIVYVSQTINGCESPRATVKATVYPIPPAPTVRAQGSICQFSTTSSLTATGSVLTWYDQLGKLPGAPTPNTSSSGMLSYSVSQSVNTCESPRTTVSVVITPAPAPPVTTSVRYCVGETPRPLNATGSNLKWYTLLTDGAASSASPSFSTLTADLLTYYVSQTDANNCESPRQPVSVSVVATPVTPTVGSVALCQGAQGQFSTTIPGALWYTAAMGGIPSSQPPVVNNQIAGEQTVYVSQTVNGCESPRAAVKATIFPIPPAPPVQTQGPICQFSTVSPLVATGSDLSWYGLSGKLAGAPTPTTSSPGPLSYSVTQRVNNCESARTTVNLIVLPAPVPPTATPALFCVGEVARPVSATGINLRWYTSDISGTASPITPGFFTDKAAVLTFYVTQTDANNCESPRQSLTVSIVAPPAAPTVTANQVVCQSATIAQLTASPNTGLIWQGPGVTGNGETAPIPSTSQPGAFTYLVAQRAGSCTSPASQIVLTVRPTPAKPVVQSTVAFCVGTTGVPLSATATGRLTWYVNANLSGPSLAEVTPNTSQANITTYYVTQKDGNNCESLSSVVEVRVSTKATARLTGDGTVYPGDSTAIRVRLSGDGPWLFTDWNGQPVTARDSLYVIWERPMTTRTYAIMNLSSTCGAGAIQNSYTLIVLKPLGTQPLIEPLVLNAYPSPTTGDLFVDWQSPTKQAITLQLIDATGKIIEEITRQAASGSQTERFQMSNHPTGTYILNVTTANNGKLTRRVVKQ